MLENATCKLSSPSRTRLHIPRLFYLLLTFAGLVFPWYFFISFLVENGVDLILFRQQLFANHISTFFAIDLIITAIVMLVFLYTTDRQRANSRWHLFALATIAIGPSFSIPLYLYSRTRIKTQPEATSHSL